MYYVLLRDEVNPILYETMISHIVLDETVIVPPSEIDGNGV